jgi:hypothetical protein
VDQARGQCRSRLYRFRVTTVADDKTQTAPEDMFLVELTDDYELAFWAKRFGVSKVRLAEAIRRVGTNAAAVEVELKRRE